MTSLSKIIISIVVTTAIVGGGGWYYMDQNAQKDKSDLQEQIDNLNKQLAAKESAASTSTTTSTSATATATDETANWATYTNSTYGFSFKYPATLVATDNLDQTGHWTVNKKLEMKDSVSLLDIYVNPDGFGPFFPDYEYQITASSAGLTISSKNQGIDQNRLDGSTLAISQFTYGSNEYLIHYKVSGSDSQSLKTLDKILATFQFTK